MECLINEHEFVAGKHGLQKILESFLIWRNVLHPVRAVRLRFRVQERRRFVRLRR